MNDTYYPLFEHISQFTFVVNISVITIKSQKIHN